MPSSKQANGYVKRTYKSNIPKKQVLITPNKLSKKNITYGRNSSAKKTRISQIYDWENILNDSTAREEQGLGYEPKVIDGEGNKEQTYSRTNDRSVGYKTACETKRKDLRTGFSNDIDVEQDGSKDIGVKERNAENLPTKVISDQSQDKDYFGQNLTRKDNSDFVPNKIERDNKMMELTHDGKLGKESISFSSNTEPSAYVKNSLTPSKMFRPTSPIRKRKNLNLSPLINTPKSLRALEIPSSQSPATPISLSKRSLSISCNSVNKESIRDPTPFNLQKNKLSSPEVFDTLDNEIRFSFVDRSIQDNSDEKDSNLKVRDTFDLGSDFSLIELVKSSPTKKSNPPTSVKSDFSFQRKESENCSSNASLYQESKSATVSMNRLFELKTEISDSEAESDEEANHSEVKLQFKTNFEENSEKKNHKKLNHQIEDMLIQKSSRLTKIETCRSETLSPVTQFNFDRFTTAFQVSEASCRALPFNDVEIPKKSSEINQKEKEDFSKGTQYIESMRLSTQYLSQMAPRTSESDIFLSIDTQRVAEILNRLRDHETRRYRLPPPVSRVWLYERQPICAVKYMAEISSAKRPGEIINETGIGNKEFNSRKSNTSWNAYEILQLYELGNPLSLNELISKEWLKGAPKPTLWAKIPPAVVDELVANLKLPLVEYSLHPITSLSPVRSNNHANVEKVNSNNSPAPLELPSTKNLGYSNDIDGVELTQYPPYLKLSPPKEFRSSQATTVDLTQVQTPRQLSIDIICETPTQSDVASTPLNLPTPQPLESQYNSDQQIQMPFAMLSSQILRESQLLPESLLNDCTLMPLPILPSSEDYTNN